MGKNKCGGNKQKAMENNRAHGNKNSVQYSAHQDEIYVVVTKSLGNSTFHVSDHLGNKYIAHVRGKMRGASKRKFFIHLNDILLVELRAYEKNCSNCDVLCIYNDTHHANIKTYPDLLLIAAPNNNNNNSTSTSTSTSNSLALSIVPEVDIDIQFI